MSWNRSCSLAVVLVAAAATSAFAQWTQFGGPNRNFIVDGKGLADKWPDEGPKKLWSRELGDGYATIVADGDVLFTMYRVNEDEFTVALDAKTGKTVWEHKNPSPFTKLMAEFGPGPHATPLIVGDRLYTIGTNAVMHAYDKKTGKVLWKHDLPAEFKAPVPGRGYGVSPIAYKNTIIVVVDRERAGDEGGKEESPAPPPGQGQSLMAFDQETGSVVWKAQDYDMSYASPILIKFDGQDQLVIFSGNELAGLNPENGEVIWVHPHKTQFGANLSTPTWDGKDILFSSAAYGSGSRGVKLVKKDGKITPEELWHNPKMRIHHANSVIKDGYVYGSSGDFGPILFIGLDVKTGKILWRERGLSKATCVLAGDKLVILDEDGQLALTSVTPTAFTVHCKVKLLEKYAWAAPTLVGTKLYIRDRKNIMALDLG